MGDKWWESLQLLNPNQLVTLRSLILLEPMISKALCRIMTFKKWSINVSTSSIQMHNKVSQTSFSALWQIMEVVYEELPLIAWQEHSILWLTPTLHMIQENMVVQELVLSSLTLVSFIWMMMTLELKAWNQKLWTIKTQCLRIVLTTSRRSFPRNCMKTWVANKL